MNLLTKQEAQREWTYGEKDGREGVGRASGMGMYTLLCLKWIINDILCSTMCCGSLDGRGLGGEWVHVYGRVALLCAWNCHNVVNRLCACSASHSCPTLCNPMDCSRQASLFMEILQARILEWVAMPSSRGSSQPRDQTQVSHTVGRFFTIWATREAQEYWEWVAYPFSRGSSQPRERTRVSCIAGRFFTSWTMTMYQCKIKS